MSNAQAVTEVPNVDESLLEDPAGASEEVDQEDLPPLRLHATRVKPVLKASEGITTQPSPHHARRSSWDRSKNSNPSSRSRSPSLKQGEGTATTAGIDGTSSLSSLEDFLDSDILTDKMGLRELNSEEQEQKTHVLHLSSGSLPCVHERMSEETLDDVHAFSDLQVLGLKTPSLSSRGNSTVGTAGDVGSGLLETLDEIDEADFELSEQMGSIILTNMENLTIHENEAEDTDDGADLSLEPRGSSRGDGTGASNTGTSDTL